MNEKLKLYSKGKLIDIIEKLSVEYAIKNQQYEYLRHNNLQQRIDKAIELLENDINFSELCNGNEILCVLKRKKYE